MYAKPHLHITVCKHEVFSYVALFLNLSIVGIWAKIAKRTDSQDVKHALCEGGVQNWMTLE